MPTPVRLKAPFRFAQHYHLMFQSIDGLILFRSLQHQRLFLKACVCYLKPFFRFRAYTLLSNQAHMVVTTQSEKQITEAISWLPFQDRTRSMSLFQRSPSEALLNRMLERQVNRMLVSYVNSYNYYEERAGGLFQKPFKRVVLENKEAMKEAIMYVHTCAQLKQLVSDYRAHSAHSWMEILNKNSLLVETDSVLELFEDPETYRIAHQRYIQFTGIS
jgi:hypothetical protein